MIKVLAFILFILQSTISYSQNAMIDNSTVQDFDIDKYLGTWYEIARYDHSFERNLVGVTATYIAQDNGKIEVTNRGYKGTLNGKLKEAKGKAKIPNLQNPAHLRVSFFLFFYSDYKVMELCPDYSWAVVGSDSDKYLWILARKPYITLTLYNEILEKIEKRGYSKEDLIKVEHNMDYYVEFPPL